MAAKTHGEYYPRKTWKKQIRILVALLIFGTIILSSGASAYTAPYRLMVFTDKQVYLDYGYDLATGVRSSNNDNTKGSFNQRPNVFAMLIDSDGNIVRGFTNSNFSARLMDVERWNHSGAALNSYPFYQAIPTGGAYYPNSTNIFPTFADLDNDGIFNSTLDTTDVNDLPGSKPPTTDQLNVSINVTIRYQGVNYTKEVYVIFGTAGCYHPGNTFSSAHGRTGHGDVPCTTCHWGYQYALGEHGPNNSLMTSDPARYTGVPAWTTVDNWDYRTGLRNGTNYVTTWDNSNAGYCMMCHSGPANANILDLGVGSSPASTDQNADGLNDANRPSCSWYQGPLGNNSAYPGCHAPQTGSNGSTKIASAQLLNVDWKGWSTGAASSKVHNHSIPPRTNGIPCELCHAGGGAPDTGTGGMHTVAGLPNRSTDYANVNDQCWNCHDRTDGWLNITANGGNAINHSRTDKCSNCHTDNNRLNVHNVPTGAFGGRWCLNCHNLTGKAPIDHKVDPAITNISNPDYIHANLNNRSDATNSSRICWGCHTNDTLVVNGRVNSTSIPPAEHPDRFDMPRNCTGCHNNSNSVLNFGAPQTYRHTWYAPTMITSAVTYCVNCHAQEEMVNKWSEGVYPPKSDNESTSHYGKNRSFFFEPLIGTRQYCGYCHQNESTVMGPFAKDSNKVRSDHASKPNTPGCGNATCHNRGRMHEDTLVIPNFTEASISTTCLSCHNPANYNFHNGTVTCWDCHMGNVSSDNPAWIHPIQFVQYNGNFTGAKLTAATCYDCHKSDRVDGTVNSLSGKTPPKIYSQSHSNDPMNGTKWGDYWKYTPRTYEFADYKILGGFGEIDLANPFENIKAPSNDYMQLNETQIGSNNGGVFPYTIAEQDINGPPVPNWTYSSRITAGTSTIISTQDAYYGNPAGSLKAVLKTTSNSGSGTVSWNYSFYYRPNSTQFAYTNAGVDYFINVSTGRTQTIYFRLVKPSGSIVNLATANCCATAGNSSWVTLRNDSFGNYLDEDGSVTPYKIQLYAELSATRPNTNTYTIYYDNIRLKIHEKVWNRYEIIINTTGVPTTGSSKLGMSYQMHMENATLMIYNRTLGDYEYLDTMYQGVFFDYVKDINSTHHIDPTGNGTGNVSIKLVDDDRSDIDEFSDVMHIRYLYVFTNQGLQFPCEQCHSPNKHYISPPIGSPSKFSAGNNINQSISSTGTWCQQCHWQGSANYTNMIQEFSITRIPPENIPPEITGNATYAPLGGARDGTPYQNHSGFDLTDVGCFGCHGGSLSPNAGMTAFIHGVSEGVGGGGRNCTSCHDIGRNMNKVNFSTVNSSMHATLNSGAVSTSQNATNKPCWGCHGTLNGTFANESDQPESGHNTSVYKSPRKCYDCHITGRLLFTTKNVTDHISSGYIPETDVNTSSYNPGYCSYCHNNSVNNGYEPDSMGITGGSPINASLSHYGANRTENKMMAPGINSTDCIYCHRNSSNMLTWGILAQTPVNISNKNASGGGTDHTQYTSSSQCSTCHGGYSVTSSFTFHNGALGNGSGASGGPDCRVCHDVTGAQKKVNFSAMNDSNSLHMNLNSGAFASDNAYNESKKCWACHGDGSQPSGHPGRYKSPSNCTDCHVNVSAPFGALQVSQHFWNGTNIRTPASTNCYICHNATGMIIPAYDPDGKGSVYGGANGGNDSVSHYGRKRNDMAAQQNTMAYCNNCHNGASAFPFMDSANRTISNHSSYPTNPGCRDCHDGGRLHNGTLSMTSLTMPNSTYCLACHGTPGAGNTTIKNLERHNGTGTQCTGCHLNSTKSIHPARYLQQDNTWSASPLFAVNCTSCHQTGMNGFTSAPRVPALAHSTNNYSGALWNGTQPGFWDNNSQMSACNYCHGNGALHNASGQGNITKIRGTNTVRQSLSGGTWCANCHYMKAANYSGEAFMQKPPEVLNSSGLVPPNARDGTQFYNHSGDLISGYDDAKCRTCHDNALGASATSSNFTHSLGAGGGGPDCISCHGTGGSLADGKRINQSAMNRSDAVHKDLNRNAAISDANLSGSRKCWACHGDGTEPSGHPAGYRTPYSCIECHVDGQGSSYDPNNTILGVTQHYWNGTSITTSSATSCYICHNKSEMMTGMSLDPDGAGTVGAGNGGNGSVSHYGKKRSDMAALDNTSYCNYCHNNISSVFPFANATNNKTILNHSINYPATNPACAACHASGRLHSSALVKPAFNFTGTTYCLSCHGKNTSGGTNFTGAATSPKEGHNDSLCSRCHLSSTKGIHSARYLRQNGTLATSNISAVNCTSCHQGQGMSDFAAAAIVQTPLWHSNDTYSGALWNGTQARYWDNNSQQSSCDYCHGKESIHNSSGLGRSALIQGTNVKNQSLSGSFWCANCHYKGAAPTGKYSYNGDLLNPVPPEIFNLTGLMPANSSNGIPFQNHTTNIGGDWSDIRCKNCHGKDLAVGTTSATFVHKLNTSASETGGPDCLKCHASTATMVESEGTPADMRINKTAFITYGVHRNINSNAVSTVPLSDNRSKACWVCHGDGTQPIKHHVDYFAPKSCEYCHVTGNNNTIYSHYPGSVFLGTIVYDTSDTNRTCTSCHSNSIVADTNITYGSALIGRIKNASVSHYAVNRTTGLSIGTAATGVLPNTASINGCRDCHNLKGGPYGSNGLDYGNARDIPLGHNDMGSTPVECENVCHNSWRDANNISIPVSLHDMNISIYVGGTACYTQGCHDQPAPDPGGGGTR